MQKTVTSHSAHPRFASTNPAADQQEMAHIAQIRTRLDALCETSTGVHQTLAGCVAIQNERPNILGCAMLRRDNEGELQVGAAQLKDDSLDLAAISTWLLPKAHDGLAKNLPVIASAAEAGCECIVAPMHVMDACGLITIARGPLSNKQRSLELAIAQLITSVIDGSKHRTRAGELTQQIATTAAALELVLRVQKALTVDEACLQVVADLKEHWNCDQVFIGFTENRKTCRIKAASDVAVIDANADATSAMKAVLDEAVGRGSVGSWPPLPGVDPHQLLAHKQLAQRDRLIVTTPLKTIEGEVIGAIAMQGAREMTAIVNIQHAVASIGEPLGCTLAAVRAKQTSRLRRAVRSVMSDKHRLKRWVACGTILASIAILAAPWPYTINCKSLVEPVERRFCVAPHEGILKTTLAEPGDVVQRGQLLAQMDGREILWELAGVSAEKTRAAKKRDTHRAKHETPEALMADLELRSLENQESLLTFKESNLEMHSPIEGIVLSGSLDRRENYPVSKGQVLYEVAPLNEVRIEVAMPADEVMHTEAGDEVQFYFDGFGTQAITGTIDRIRPRAEIRGDENVFIAEVTIPNDNRELRPGMEGIGKVKTESRRIAWIIFHRAIEHTRAAMPW